jgi:alkylation response protein AidB-like acyl-CoA dehydrogenase
VRLTFGDEVEAFRQEFLAWLADNRPTADEMAEEPAVSSAHVPGWASRWTRRMFDAGWLVPGWPPERGGRNAGPVETLVYLEERTKAGIPRTTNPQGLGIVVPSILDYGTDDQIRDYAMTVLRGERSACLGMSEPDAGSDLASLSTRAVLDGDRFVINGQKVWTSGANYADFCFLFCRTDPEAPKHRGISVVLVDMSTPGVTVRPLAEIAKPEHPDLNEVFLSDVVGADGEPRRRDEQRVGHGQRLAGPRARHGVAQLRHDARGRRRRRADRGAGRARPAGSGRAGSRGRRPRRVGDRLGGGPLPGLPGLRQAGAGRLRTRAGADEGVHQRGQATAGAAGGRARGRPHGRHRPDARERPTWIEHYFISFGGTISAGSSEIQRNIIAEKVLGLPR